jgi:hypothetical protein
MGFAKEFPAKYDLCTQIVDNLHKNRKGFAT